MSSSVERENPDPVVASTGGKQEEVTPGRRKTLRRVFDIFFRVVVLAGLALVARDLFSTLQAEALASSLRAVGWSALFALIPATLLTLSDSVGWAACITNAPRRLSLPTLVAIRVSCDAVCNSLPAGVAAGEGLRAVLLRDRVGLDMTQSGTCCLLGKINMGLAHMGYVAIVLVGLFLGVGGAVQGKLLPGGSMTLLAGTVTAGAIAAVLSFSYTGPRFTQLVKGIARVGRASGSTFVERLLLPLARVDAQVGAFAREHSGRLRISLAAYFVGWLALGSESAIILMLLGAPLPLFAALSLEAVISVLRIVFFFLPSAVGAAEVAYIGILTAYGVPDPVTTSAAFIAFKRSRELLWILAGYAILAAIRVRR